ncbi:hypothetical protein BUALT_Bualt02G0088600 [Buddleja alternifolia]|uniref:SAP domain-containing protein n=1 Tax=Buddleja alternifolia TaxID=168488 RepID=A0AAV6XYP2_9LAMI|nr:hypothetical protein BUALT_Bualt02G0088600 [Buddleja alternifolia]
MDHTLNGQLEFCIRSLILNNQKGDSCSKGGKGSSANRSSRKRHAEKALDEGSSLAHDGELQSLKVERLQALLREKGLSTSGRKASSVDCPLGRCKWLEGKL